MSVSCSSESAGLPPFEGMSSPVEFSASQIGRPDLTKAMSSASDLEWSDEYRDGIIESPDLAGMAVEAIDPEWLQSTTAKMLMSAYQDLELAGRALDLGSVLLLIENEFLKNQLVSCEQRVRERQGKIEGTPGEQFTSIVARYREREIEMDADRKIQQLESAVLGEDEEDALLRELFDAERARYNHQQRDTDDKIETTGRSDGSTTAIDPEE